jgi:hypothetical protein
VPERAAKPATNLEDFEVDLTTFFEKTVPAAHLALQKKIALDLLRKIVLRTPVGNPDLWKAERAPPGYVGGRARANWQVSINVEPGAAAKDDRDKQGTATISQGEAAILGLTQPGGVIWLFNNVPYILRLENGWSTQAPQGMLRLAIAELEAGLNSDIGN